MAQVTEAIYSSKVIALILGEFSLIGNIDKRSQVQCELNKYKKPRFFLHKILSDSRLCVLHNGSFHPVLYGCEGDR